VVSRYIVITLALVAAAIQMGRGAWVEAIGLIGLGGGLVVLKLAATKPALKPFAYVGFFVTAVAMVTVAMRRF
jgi:hypothetical protein